MMMLDVENERTISRAWLYLGLPRQQNLSQSLNPEKLFHRDNENIKLFT
jgi:hypothetical protein